MVNVVLKAEYPKDYTPAISTQVSNALLVGEILGQLVIGLTCDYLGRKAAIVITTLLIVIGGILSAGASGPSTLGMFWMLTVARGITGFGVGGEYPASSTSASEAANERALANRGPVFVLVTNLPLSFGGPFAVIVFLIVASAAGTTRYSTIWRVCMAIGCVFPLSVFYFRLRMLNSKLYRRGAIKRRVPYGLVLRYYWKDLIGTCGAWFLYDLYVAVFSISPFRGFTGTMSEPFTPFSSLLTTKQHADRPLPASHSPTESSPARSSPPWCQTPTSSKQPNTSSSSAPSLFQASSWAHTCAT